MNRFVSFAIPCFLSTAFLVAGCAHAPQKSGVLNVAQGPDATTLDPARAYDTNCIPYVRVLYRGLVDYDQKANIVNEVAESHSVSADGKTYSFKLRDGVRFTDGTPVTADDFRFALERVLDPRTQSDGQTFYANIVGAKEWTEDRAKAKGLGAGKLKNISGIEVKGTRELYIHLLKPDATFLNNMALPFAYAVPRPYIEKLAAKVGWGNELSYAMSAAPVGDGPFKLAGWVHDGWLKLEKNPDYFRPEFPKVDTVNVQFGLTTQLQLMLFEQGSLDLLPLSDAFPPDFLRMTNDPKWKPYIAHAPMMDIRYMCMNNEVAPFTDKRVRQAFNYALNRDRIVSFLTGRATKARGALPPGMPAYNKNLFQYAYDPKKAKELLKEAGFKDDPNNPITLYYPTENEPWYAKAAQSIKADLAQVGVNISIKGMRYGDLKQKAGLRGKGGTQLALLGWYQDYPDPANFLDVLFNGKSITNTASINRAFYSNPKVNALLNEGGVETDHAKRLKDYEDAEKIIVDDAPWAFLHHTERFVARQPRVTNFKMNPMWNTTYEQYGTE